MTHDRKGFPSHNRLCMNLTGHTLNGLEQTSTDMIRQTCSDRIRHEHYMKEMHEAIRRVRVNVTDQTHESHDLSCSTETLATIFLRALPCDLVLAHRRMVFPSLDVWIS